MQSKNAYLASTDALPRPQPQASGLTIVDYFALNSGGVHSNNEAEDGSAPPNPKKRRRLKKKAGTATDKDTAPAAPPAPAPPLAPAAPPAPASTSRRTTVEDYIDVDDDEEEAQGPRRMEKRVLTDQEELGKYLNAM